MKISATRTLFISCLGLLCLVVPVHLWLVDRHAFMRAVFVVQAPVAKASGDCSEGAPEWLSRLTADGISRLKALSTQVALLNIDGQLFHCETGWESTMLLSRQVDKDTRFRYGSMTKPFTASKVLSVVEQKRLTLNATLGELFSVPTGGGAVHDVTLGQLLSHRSGISGYMFVSGQKPVCPYDLKGLVSSVKVRNKGELRYSNLGYCILGEVISLLTGTPFREAMESTYHLSDRNIGYVEYEEAGDEVERDFRFNDFYGRNLKDRFDYHAISSTAGMSGSASSYAFLLDDIIDEWGPSLFENRDCDNRMFRKCYGNAFYEYSPTGESVYQVKEGYLPGAAGVVVINENHEIFVWLGNSDTENAVDGNNMREFLSELARAGF